MQLKPEAQYTVFNPTEIELADMHERRACGGGEASANARGV